MENSLRQQNCGILSQQLKATSTHLFIIIFFNKVYLPQIYYHSNLKRTNMLTICYMYSSGGFFSTNACWLTTFHRFPSGTVLSYMGISCGQLVLYGP